MFYKSDDRDYRQPREGIRLKTLSHGERTHMVEFRLSRGSTLEEHSHPHEQIGYLVSGRIVLVIEGRRNPAGPGDSWCIAGNVPHSAEVLEDALVIEVFSPVREDLLHP